MELDQLLIVKNVVQLENISILILVFAVLAVMVSSNQTKVHSHVTFVGWARQQDQQKLNRVQNVAMNVHQECNLVLMENANHVQEAHSDLKEFNQLVKLVHWVERHLKLAQLQLKNARYLSAHLEHILTQQSTFVLNVVKDISNQNLNKHHALPVHQITAQRTLPQPRKLNVQIHARQHLKVTNIAIQMHIAFSYQKHQISNVNVSQDLMVPDIIVLVSKRERDT